MDNFNGQNQFNANQNQFAQGQYQQMPQQQMYQQPQYYGQNKPAKKKKSWLKWLLIAGIPTVVVATTVLILILIFSGYDIDDRKEFADVCEDVLDVELKKDDLSKTEKKVYGMSSYYYGDKETEDVYSSVRWIKFNDDEAAEKYYNMTVLQAYSNYYEYINEYDGKWESDDDYTEGYYERDDYQARVIFILEDEYVVRLNISGDDKDVEKLAKKWLEEID